MKTNSLFLTIPCAVILGLAGCSKNETAANSAPPQSPPTAPAKPAMAELTKENLLDAFKRSSINGLPVFLKISDVQFDVVNSVDTVRVIKGTVMLDFLEDTFQPSRSLEYRNPSVNYQIQLLKSVKKKGERISLPFSDRIDLANNPPSVPMPPLDDYGNGIAQFPHSYIEGSEKATTAENLIAAAAEAKRKADVLREKWEALKHIKQSLESADSYFDEKNNKWLELNFRTAFGDEDFSKQVFPYRSMADAGPARDEEFKAYVTLATPRLNDEYSHVEKIIQDAKDKDKACADYLLTL